MNGGAENPSNAQRNVSLALTLLIQAALVVGRVLFVLRRDGKNVFLTALVILLTLVPALLSLGTCPQKGVNPQVSDSLPYCPPDDTRRAAAEGRAKVRVGGLQQCPTEREPRRSGRTKRLMCSRHLVVRGACRVGCITGATVRSGPVAVHTRPVYP